MRIVTEGRSQFAEVGEDLVCLRAFGAAEASGKQLAVLRNGVEA